MNKARRKTINAIISKLQELEALFDEAKADLETVKDEEVEYRDNMPENLQGSEKYELADAAANNLEEAYSSIEELDISDIISKLEEAVQ